MRIANLAGRLALLRDGTALDVETASGGTFTTDPQAVYERWEAFTAWADGASFAGAAPFDDADLLNPVPAPRQVFAIGLNYRDHAAESGQGIPDDPVVFTKFVSSLTGPTATVVLPEGSVDYEVELVVVIGRAAKDVAEEDGWAHVAGLAVGQDLSERRSQLRGPAPQFGLAKSFPGFGPVGPAVVTPDELDDPDALRIRAELTGAGIDGTLPLQDGTTADMIFSVPALVARLSAVLPLLPGDIVFTGTPAGVGMGRKPPLFLQPGQVLVSTIEGIGTLRNPLV